MSYETPIEEPAPASATARETQLSEYGRILLERRAVFLGCVAAALLVAAASSLTSRPSYRGTAIVHLEAEQANPLEIRTGPRGPDPSGPETFATEMELMKSRDVVERVARKRTPEAGADVTAAAIGIQKSLETSRVRGTNLVAISCVADSPAAAAETANEVARAYIEWKLDAKFRLVGQAAQFLDSQIRIAKADLKTMEASLLASGKRASAEDADALARQLSEATADCVSKEARLKELNSRGEPTLADLSQSALVAELRGELARLEKDYDSKLRVFKPDYPAAVQARDEVERVRKQLKEATREAAAGVVEAARSEYLLALRRQESLKAALRSQNAEFGDLRTETEMKRAFLESLMRQSADNQLLQRLEGERVSNVRVVETALPPRSPFRPSHVRNALAGLAAGILVGLVLALVLDYMDRTIRKPEQVREILKLPLLGAIPAVRATGGPQRPTVSVELLPHEVSRSAATEAYRSFRTSLLLSRADGIRSLVVTSALPLEGKTTTAVNLAVVLAQLGRRVLVVDADLYRPRLHEVFKVTNRTGLVSVLAEGLDLEEAVRRTEVPLLFVLPSGPTPPDPSGLIFSASMGRFLERIRSQYDNVVIDAPPVLAISDGVVLGHETDGVVLCVRAGKTRREQVERARDRLRSSRVHILGVLLNQLEPERGLRTEEAYYQGYEAQGQLNADGGGARGPRKARRSAGSGLGATSSTSTRAG